MTEIKFIDCGLEGQKRIKGKENRKKEDIQTLAYGHYFIGE